MSETEQQPVVQLRHGFMIVSEGNETAASATVERMNGVRWLTNVWTHHKYRRKGYATHVLRAVVAAFGADDLWLKIHPYTDRPRDEVELAAFYGRFGFGPADAPGIMRRPGDGL